MENDLIEWIRQQQSGSNGAVALGIGDDAALLNASANEQFVVATDLLCEGVHFRDVPHQFIGRKALAVNLSDLAAMGAKPLAAFVSLLLPRSMTSRQVESLMNGMLELADEFELQIAGGDTNAWDGLLAVNVAVVGSVAAGRGLLRSSARLGDAIIVTGELGGSIYGKHYSFTPRLQEITSIRDVVEVHAAIDVSDGLLLDLHRLTQESNCGAEVELESIPISKAAYQDNASSKVAQRRALSDGEDFELIFTTSDEDATRLITNPPTGTRLSKIGRIVSKPGLRSAGDGTELKPIGFEHSFGKQKK